MGSRKGIPNKRSLIIDKEYFNFLGLWDQKRIDMIHTAFQDIMEVESKAKEALLGILIGAELTEDITEVLGNKVLMRGGQALSAELLSQIHYRQWQFLPLAPPVYAQVLRVNVELANKIKAIRIKVLRLERDYILIAMGGKPKRKRLQ